MSTLCQGSLRMTRTQLNVNIDPELMDKLKVAAIMSGKTITEFVSESISTQLKNTSPVTIKSRLLSLEERIQSLENNLYVLTYSNQK